MYCSGYLSPIVPTKIRRCSSNCGCGIHPCFSTPTVLLDSTKLFAFTSKDSKKRMAEYCLIPSYDRWVHLELYLRGGLFKIRSFQRQHFCFTI